MSTSPGKRGGQTNHENLQQLMPFWGAKVVSTFRLPQFYQQVVDGELSEPYKSELAEAEAVEILETMVISEP